MGFFISIVFQSFPFVWNSQGTHITFELQGKYGQLVVVCCCNAKEIPQEQNQFKGIFPFNIKILRGNFQNDTGDSINNYILLLLRIELLRQLLFESIHIS